MARPSSVPHTSLTQAQPLPADLAVGARRLGLQPVQERERQLSRVDALARALAAVGEEAAAQVVVHRPVDDRHRVTQERAGLHLARVDDLAVREELGQALVRRPCPPAPPGGAKR